MREYPEIDEFQIHLYTAEGIRDEIEVLVEIPDPDVDGARILGDLLTGARRRARGPAVRRPAGRERERCRGSS